MSYDAAMKPRSSRVKIKIGQSAVNQSDLGGLQKAWKEKQLVLFLGAGVSMPYGVPSWKDLVLELLFDQTEHTRRLGPLLPHYRRALASWMTDYFDYSPLVLARMVERYARNESKKKGTRKPADNPNIFLEKLRSQLYAAYKPAGPRTTLQAIAQMIKRSNGNVRSVITFNFDGLLEEELARIDVPTIPVVDGTRQYFRDFRVIHPHGFVPRQGPIDRESLVFTEDNYHKLTEEMFHWGLSEIVNELRHSTALFIGLSMSDPSLRRLLDACHNSKVPPHWQLQKRHQVRPEQQIETMNDITNRARRWGEILDIDVEKDEPQLADALHNALRQADTYDRELFEAMGVKTIWLESYDDIPLLLDRISARSRSRSNAK
jgi:hypothetical protein